MEIIIAYTLFIISCCFYWLLLLLYKILEKSKKKELLPYHDTSNKLKEIFINNII